MADAMRSRKVAALLLIWGIACAPAWTQEQKNNLPVPPSQNQTGTIIVPNPAWSGAKMDETPAQKLYAAARTAGNNRDFNTCAQLLEQVVSKDPNYKIAWSYLGYAYNSLGKYDKAETALRKAIALNPTDAFSYNNLGQALLGQKKYDEAIPQFQKQIELNPRDQWAHTNLGRLYVQQQQYEKAIPELETAATIKPDDPYIPFNLGRAYARTAQPEKALQSLERSVDLQPVPFRWNAVAYEMAVDKLDLEQAEKYAVLAIAATVVQLRSISLEHVMADDARLTSSLAAYWDTFGWIRFQRGDLPQAEKYVKSAWQVRSIGEVGDHLGQIYEKQGRKAEATHQYELTLATTQPPAETRGRLMALLGSDAAVDVDKLTADACPQLKEARTIPVKNAHQAEGIAEFWILLSPGPTVRGIKFITGDDELAQFSKDLQVLPFPDSFPEATEVQLLRRGRLSCAPAAANCSLFLVSADAARQLDPSSLDTVGENSSARFGNNILPTKLIVKVPPIYPEEARLNRIEGTVKLHAIIGKDGSVERLTLVSGHPSLVPAAMNAVNQWKYEPLLVNNQPVEVEFDVEVVFRLTRKN